MKRLILFVIICVAVQGLYAFSFTETLKTINEKCDFVLNGGFTTTRVAGKSIKQSELQGYKFEMSHGYLWGLSTIYTHKEDYPIKFEGGFRYLEKGYEVYHKQYYHYGHYYLHKRHKEYFYDELKSSYLDFYVKFKPKISSALDMEDLSLSLNPFMGFSHGFLMAADDKNMDGGDTTILLGVDVIYNKRFVLGLEYNKGISNIFIDGRADHESFNCSIGVIF
jgi:hypothetical protein